MTVKNKRIYLDYNSTTPVDPRVVEVMMPYFTERFGNAASRNHPFGWEAEEAVDTARTTIAQELNAKNKEIVFTSGATESVNLAIKGVCEVNQEKGKHLVTQVTEHKAVLDTCKTMERRGWEVIYLPVDKDGRVDPGLVRENIRNDTVMVAIMHANNEIGTIQAITDIGLICKTAGVFFLVDAAQSYAKMPINVEKMGIDLLAASGHKIYGPKGVGFLYIRRRNPEVTLTMQIDGGSHERGRRSGTLAVPQILGMAKATEIYRMERDEENKRLVTLREKLLTGILNAFPDTVINGTMEDRLPNNLNLAFPDIEAESLIMGMDGIACSTGSACTSASLEASHVIKALGVREELAHSSVRLSLGRYTTEEEINLAIGQIVKTVSRLKKMVPLWTS